MVKNSVFPDSLKQADITPLYKNDTRNEKENYRPVSIIPNLSRIYGRRMYTQINKWFGPILSKYGFGFRKGHNAQRYLLTMIEKWKVSLDQNRTCSPLLTDLPKPLDCLPHDLLIDRLHTYGCDLPSLKSLSSYLRNKHQHKQFLWLMDRNFIWSPTRIFSRFHIF